MNIFYLSHDIRQCAKYHVQMHVNKMQLEMAQQMCIAVWVDRLLGFRPHTLKGKDYRVVRGAMEKARGLAMKDKIAPYATVQHINHPCSVWVRSSRHNFEYTRKLIVACTLEQRWRQRHHKGWIHASCRVALDLRTFELPWSGWTFPPRCIDKDDPDKYGTDTLMAYREYYRRDKRHLHDWGRRGRPYWLDEVRV